MLVYHFVGKALRDGKPIPKDGEWLTHEGPIKPCESGLHGSEHPFDALQYAPGATLCLCELEGDLQSHGNPIDKWVGRRRKILKRFDATHLLRRFAADQALSVSHLWNMPPIVKEYLITLDETKRTAARAAARDAVLDASVLDAAWAAALDAAWAAAQAAAWDAAWAASLTTARASVLDAAWDAAWAAAWAAARDEFKKRVDSEFEKLGGQS